MHIFSLILYFIMDVFGEDLAFESLSLDMIDGKSRVATTCITNHMKCHVMSCDLEKVLPC